MDSPGARRSPDLIVTTDIAGEAAKRFLDIAPKTLVVAGGNTPRPVYERLAMVPHPWSQTSIYFGDERCVPPTDPASNFRMASEALLAKVPASVYPMPGSCDARAYEALLRRHFGADIPVFDLVFLGLGEDGHTASLFPGSPALTEQTRLVVAVERPDHHRITMTLPVLSAARAVIFLVSGRDKRRALGQLLRGEDIPAARVLARRTLILADPDASPATG